MTEIAAGLPLWSAATLATRPITWPCRFSTVAVVILAGVAGRLLSDMGARSWALAKTGTRIGGADQSGFQQIHGSLE